MPITPIPGIEVQPGSIEDYIFKNGMANLLILDSAPTTSNGILPEGRFGVHSTNLYLTTSGNCYRVASLTLV